MNLPFFWIDAFTLSVGKGNPAAVVPLERWLDDRTMQAIAFENGLSETAFFVKTGPARFHLRWFTPSTEVNLCGHATLASASVLFDQLGEPSASLCFDSHSGPLSARRTPEGRIELDFPVAPVRPAAALPDLPKALGAQPVEILASGENILCVLASAPEVSSLRPDIPLLSRIPPARFIVTAPGDNSCDFVSRFFAPGVGVPEDPVTGSAHCALMPYWAERLGRRTLFARQVSQRSGELWCTLDNARVRISGHAVCYLTGSLACP